MAATDARPVPRKNAAYRVYFSIRNTDGSLITTWSGQDSEVSLDGAAFSDCTNEATEIGSSGCGYMDFTSDEMNADAVVYKLSVSNTGAIPLVFALFPEEAGDYRAEALSLATQAKADVNAEVLDVLVTDTFTEQATVPGATSSLKDKLGYMFMWFRNRSTQTSSQRTLFADDNSTVVATESCSDDNTTYTKGKAS